MRDFVHRSLYDHSAGYFATRDVIYAPPAYVDFNNLLGQMEYRQVLARLYAASEHAWLTPVLVFAPWYSYAIAKWLVKGVMALRARGGGRHAAAPLVVYEVGGGTGTNARAVCDWVKAHAPQLYRSMSYTVLEISPALHARQNALLAAGGHEGVARSVLADATDLAAAGVTDGRPCAVVACEVLDNLPHDKVVRLAATPDAAAGDWHEVHVARVPLPAASAAADDGREAFREVLRPLADPLIARTLPFVLASGNGDGSNTSSSGSLLTTAAEAARGAVARLRAGREGRAVVHDRSPLPPGVSEARYVPTGSRRLLESLQAAFPRHGLWAADFDALPPPALDLRRAAREDNLVVGDGGDGAPGYYPARTCAPLVASKGTPGGGGSGGGSTGAGGRPVTVDHPTYLSPRPRGAADIFFPTDFAALAAMLADVRAGAGVAAVAAASDVRVLSQAAFMAGHADVARTATLGGYNPLLQDYANTRVLVAEVATTATTA